MPMIAFLLLGLGIGVASGVLGIGGGVLLIPLLMWLAPHYDQPRAAGITLAVLSVPVALPAVLEYLRNGTITPREIWIAAWIAVGFAIGGYTGAHLRPLFDASLLRLLFGLLLLFVAVRFLITIDSDVQSAVMGLTAVAVAGLMFWRLKRLGHRFRPAAEIADRIRAAKPPEHAEGDYYI